VKAVLNVGKFKIRKSISTKIILSYLIIVITSMVIVGVIFNVASRKYIQKKISDDLSANINKVNETLKKDLGNIKKNSNATENMQFENRAAMMRAALRKSILVSEAVPAFISEDMKVMYPRMGDEFDKMNQILPIIKAKMASKVKGVSKITLDGKEYITAYGTIVQSKGWIVLYAPVEQAQQLGRGTLFVLLIPLLVAGGLALICGVIFARSIAKPIILLKNRTEMLSKRDFDTKVEIHTGDELEELANTINKMADELKEYDIAQKKFLQNASHELKTPLMSIQGYAEGIKDGVFEDDEKALGIIVDESTRLKSIVEELIFLSKLETMDDFYKFSRQSINNIIEKSIEKINSIALKDNININSMLYKDAYIKVDKDKITQALINILGNCLRYAKSMISITTRSDGKWFDIKINDDGEGFDNNEIKNVFERFYKGKKGNTGLGLAITKVIVEKHNGTIEAATGSNGGAEFKIRLRIE
jgi:two-component system, OmpR family, sensor histidine kinase CssS